MEATSMSLANQVALAVERASYPQLSNLSRAVWSAWSAGTLSDADAQAAAEALHARRSGGMPGYLGPLKNAPRGFLLARARAPERHFDRKRSLERRRMLATSGHLPPPLRAHFTTGQAAVMRIVGDECRQRGQCTAYLDELAARAGCSRSTAKSAIVQACRVGMLLRIERRRRGQASLTNVLRIISPLWLAWLRVGPRGGGVNFQPSAESKCSSEEHRGQNFGGRRAAEQRIERRNE
jgi:hypothetical protein